jgi:hypothetical protein
MYENSRMRLVEGILRRGEGDKGEWWKGVNLTKIYCKHFLKCHNVHPAQQQCDNKNKIEKKLLCSDSRAL